MSARDEFDRRLSAWMADAVASPPPTGRFEQAMQATARRRPRPRWLATLGSSWIGSSPNGANLVGQNLRRAFVLVTLLALLAAVLLAAMIVGASLLRPNPVRANGWVVFAQSDRYAPSAPGIYLVREGQPPRRIVGSDSDGLDRICPVFSPDGTHVAYGQGQRSTGDDQRVANAALVIVDLDAEGSVARSTEVAVGDGVLPPCAIWSPDSQHLAFGVAGGATAAALWVVRLGDRDPVILPGLSAVDLDWSPDGSRLAIVSYEGSSLTPDINGGGPIRVYSLSSGELETMPGTSGAQALALSPDGARIAYQRPGTRGLVDLVVRELDTGQEHSLASGYTAFHGVGPVWAPAGDRIVYQRVCPGCREGHEVVVITAGAAGWRASDATERVLPPVALAAPDDKPWYPFRVTWSPDGTKLLYLAWGDPQGGSSFRTGLLAVPVSLAGPPVLLVDDQGLVVYQGLFTVTIQAWGREPQTREVK